MSFYINAWLERDNPKLELRESASNRMIYKLEGDLLNHLLEIGEINVPDLYSHDNPHELIKDLLLTSISKPIEMLMCNYQSAENVINFPQTNTQNRKLDACKCISNNNVIYL